MCLLLGRGANGPTDISQDDPGNGLWTHSIQSVLFQCVVWTVLLKLHTQLPHWTWEMFAFWALPWSAFSPI